MCVVAVLAFFWERTELLVRERTWLWALPSASSALHSDIGLFEIGSSWVVCSCAPSDPFSTTLLTTKLKSGSDTHSLSSPSMKDVIAETLQPNIPEDSVVFDSTLVKK